MCVCACVCVCVCVCEQDGGYMKAIKRELKIKRITFNYQTLTL